MAVEDVPWIAALVLSPVDWFTYIFVCQQEQKVIARHMGTSNIFLGPWFTPLR